jgi:ubiquinone/menaquinone biosynthesis C-methylase UbiE
MKRRVSTELLDSDSGTEVEISHALADLRHINSWFGGVSTSRAMIEGVVRACKENSGPLTLSMLEVAAGSGYVSGCVKKQLSKSDIQLEVTLLDRAASHLGGNATNGTATQLRRNVVGDALALPFADNSFDLVSCNLFLHHLDPAQIVRFVNEALRCCCIAVLINDLVRSPLHLAMVYASLPLYRSRITRNDAPASVKQAYTPEEVTKVLSQTTAAKVDVHSYFLYRMGVVAWKRDSCLT